MRKMLVAAVILLVIAIAWSFESRAIDNICTDMITRLTLLESYLDEDEGTLDRAVEEIDSEWRKHEQTLEVLVPHDDTDNVNMKRASIMGCIEKKNYDTALLVIRELKAHFEEIRKKSRVTLTNIF